MKKTLWIILPSLGLLGLLQFGLANPTEAKGKWLVGFTNPTGQQATLVYTAKGIQNRGACFDIDFIQVDDQLSIDKQIADVDLLVSKKVDALVVFPMDAKALGPALQRAKKSGVQLFAIDYNLNLNDVEGYGPIITQVVQGKEGHAREAARYIAEKTNGKANIIAVTLGIPVPSIRAQTKYFYDEVKKFPGLKVLEEVGNPDDTAAGARPLVENMITKYKGKIDAIWAYNDASALGAFSAVKAAGLKNVVITGNNGDTLGIDAVRNGLIDITWDLNVVNVGKLMVEAVNDVLSGKKKIYEMPRSITAPEIRYGKEDLHKYVSWKQAAEQLKDCSHPNGVVRFK